MAKLLIEALTQPFDPARFKNTFRERLEQLIQSRIEGQQTTRIEPPAAAKVIDIMEALKRSLAEKKKPVQVATAAVGEAVGEADAEAPAQPVAKKRERKSKAM